MTGWGRKHGRQFFHFFKKNHPRSICSQVYHLGVIKKYYDKPPAGERVCKKCRELAA